MTLVMAERVGLVDFAIIPHVEYDDRQDVANAEKWAGRLPVPTYAIDDETAVKVVDGTVEVVSEGNWKLFNSVTQRGARRIARDLWPSTQHG